MYDGIEFEEPIINRFAGYILKDKGEIYECALKIYYSFEIELFFLYPYGNMW